MAQTQEFRKGAHRLVDWIADYYDNIESFPVKSNIPPGEVYNKIPAEPPDMPGNAEELLADFEQIILPGISHWQSPNFYALYFKQLL